tara:strand:+ start:216 stop:1631 length:1416 start_codon:yes stop_codon:yes gene_type:complete
MAYAPVDRAAQLRRYADIIGKTVTPMNAPVTPYSNPNWARLAQGLVGAGFQGAAERAASREDVLNRGRSADLARAIMGAPTVAPKLPTATGPMAGFDKWMFPSTPAAATPSLPVRNADGTTNPEAIIQAAASANVDPLAAVGSAYKMRSAQSTMASQELATSQATALRTMRRLQLSRGPDGVLSAEDQSLWDATLSKLPADVSALDIRQPIKDAEDTVIGYQNVNVLGQKVGDEKFIPTPKFGPTVNVAAGQKAFLTESAKQAVTEVGELRTKIEGNSEIVARLNVMEALLEGGMDSGPVQEALLPMRRLLADLDLLSSEDARALTNQEIFNAAAKYIIPRMRVVGSGSSSDFEQKMFASATAQLKTSPEANRIIIAGMKALEKHQRELLEMKEAYAIENESLMGFSKKANEHFKKNPIFKKYTTSKELAAAITDGKLDVGDLWFDKDTKKFRILSVVTLEELKTAGLFKE